MMAEIATYRDLIVWQKSMCVVEDVYCLTKRFPSEEKFALSNQLRRAAVSIPANIAEGRGRSSRLDFARHLFIAKGSLAELETELLIAVRLGYISRDDLRDPWNSCQEVGRMLNTLVKNLKVDH